MDKLNIDFINEIVDEYKQKRFDDSMADVLKEKLTTEAKDTAYVFVLCINKLIDKGMIK